MRIRKLVLAGAILMPGHASAQEWSHSIARGLDLYQMSRPGVTVNVICDPARVYGSDNSGIELHLGSSVSPNGSVTFRAGDTALETTALRGRIGPDAPTWPAMLDLLGTAGMVQIEHDGEVHSLDLKGPAAFSCSP